MIGEVTHGAGDRESARPAPGIARLSGTVDVPAADLMTAPMTALANNGLVVRSCRARVLRPSESRPVLRYAVTYFDRKTNAAVRKVIIGKVYARGDGAEAFECMSRLWAGGFARDPRLTIPEPLAYIPELRLLLQGRAPGNSLYVHLDKLAAALPLVRLAARWLAKLHRASLESAPLLPADYEQRKLSSYRDALVETCPSFAARIEHLTERTLASLGMLRLRHAVPTHGDFQPKNIHIWRKRVTVIDFDRIALAHPARDLGHFIGQSMTMSYVRTGSFRDIEPWTAAFLDEYGSSAPPEALRELPAFIARTFLEVLHYKLFVRPVKDPRFLPSWLDECERWLDRAPPLSAAS